MIPNLHPVAAPKFLLDAERFAKAKEFPLEDILKDSLYYPACGLNGTPIKFLAGNVFSFVYADYGVTKENYLANLIGNGPDSGFSGYHHVLLREIQRDEVVPHRWRPPILPEPMAHERIMGMQSGSAPFGHWSVWERDNGKDAAHGPKRFSIFYLAGEMSAIYMGLFDRLRIAPKILAVITPGSLGGEWETVESDDSFFKRVVGSNPAGWPEYLLYGSWNPGSMHSSCWKEYGGKVVAVLPERNARLWKRIGLS